MKNYPKEKCDNCGWEKPLYYPPWNDGTYTGTCGQCLWKHRDDLQHAVGYIENQVNAKIEWLKKRVA
jgi:hypothetical protein